MLCGEKATGYKHKQNLTTTNRYDHPDQTSQGKTEVTLPVIPLQDIVLSEDTH